MEKISLENDIKAAMHLTGHKADKMAKKQKTYDSAADFIFNEAIDISLNKPF